MIIHALVLIVVALRPTVVTLVVTILLEKYRDKYCSFNDDIQGTGSVIVAGLLAAMKTLGSRLAEHTYLFQVWMDAP